MPFSAGSFDEVTAALLEAVAPLRILDVGCGAGKYGHIVKSVLPQARLEGVEVEKSYVAKYGLEQLYAPLHLMDAARIPSTMIDEMFDLTIIGDCIEHLPKSAGIDLLNFLTYRSAYTVIVLPEAAIQNSVDNVLSEAHISVWSERDFAWHDNWAWAQVWQMQYYILRGYAPARISLADLIAKLHQRQFMLHYDRVQTPLAFTHINHTKLVPAENGGSVYWRQQ
ncbi:class I SAM-dependent methyltransferase [Paraburkholderia kururiensis]|uniref:Class I SAM-dependent methyltransferase n=1 Tax=Paraburkholderia kururiensis TaxID=984307 RepID=A0ABZ0WLG7_9BURK|nr:class I SAM-dependent methyltransferase [Paraburkholderia kururiensis]WQD78153.1 class I SAM-dependent methyltransferase [Paraburkholderia kururiensis]